MILDINTIAKLQVSLEGEIQAGNFTTEEVLAIIGELVKSVANNVD